MLRSLELCLMLLALTAAAAFSAPAPGLEARARQEAARLLPLYRELHAAPELSYFEQETSARLALELKAAGLTVTHPVGRFPDARRTAYGVVGVLENGQGPTLLLRTDLDALPVEEKTGLEFASRRRMVDVDGQEKAVMHACGHDLHISVLLGAVRVLAGMKDHWRGTLLVIGQPAEERGGGARALLADGLYSRWPSPDFALAEHVDPQLEAGTVGWCPGYAMANVDMLDLTVRGVGAHGAMPHLGRDPVVLAAQIVLALQTIVSREVDPIEPAVVTVGAIHGGTKHNIIPEEVQLQLTVRSFDPEVRERILAAIERIATGTARAAGVTEDRLPVLSGGEEFTPALYNDPALAERLAAAMARELGAERVVRIKPQTGGEDFSEYGRTGRKVPICMFRVGTGATGGDPLRRPGLHSPEYAPAAEPSLAAGIRAMSAAALELLGR